MVVGEAVRLVDLSVARDEPHLCELWLLSVARIFAWLDGSQVHRV